MQILCTNLNADGTHICSELGVKACSNCHLVKYCSETCQSSHWPLHKLDCKSELAKSTWKPVWQQEGRVPAFVGKDETPAAFGFSRYMWGNMPAFDMCRLEANENFTDQNVKILFAASGDPRNIIKTVVELPNSYIGRCEIYSNDKDFAIVARNIIILLAAYQVKDIDLMIHLWYSAMITKPMLETLQKSILPLIQDICNKIKDKSGDRLLSKTWTFGVSTLRVVLLKSEWFSLLKYFNVTITRKRASELRRLAVKATSRIDYLERSFLMQPRHRRVAKLKFRNDGLLIPFGASVVDFSVPNPTFFVDEMWPMLDDADPLNGWQVPEMGDSPKNDLYGSLYSHLHYTVTKFHDKIHSGPFAWHMSNVDARELLQKLELSTKDEDLFDRIDISNIADKAYLGPEQSLSVFSKLLKPSKLNSKATLIMLFLNVIIETKNRQDDVDSLKRVIKYAPITPECIQFSPYGVEMVKYVEGGVSMYDSSLIFKRFENQSKLHTKASKYGLKSKERHSIIEPWPFKLESDAPQAKFDELLATDHTGLERYMEWTRQ